ncbi:MAG: NAD-dependent epimerase/dehydratase family protein [Bacteroidota bacterium]
MRILLIGGNGFIGSHLQELLLPEHELFIFSRKELARPEITSLMGEHRDLMQFRDEFKALELDLVIDFIAYFAQDAWDLIHTFRQICPWLMLISSGDVYRSYEIFKNKEVEVDPNPSLEDGPLRRQLFPYRQADQNNAFYQSYEKILVEQLLLGQKEFDLSIARLGAVYGELDSQKKLSEFIHPILQNASALPIAYSQAKWKWSRMYVKNVAAALQTMIHQADKAKNEIFNIAESQALSQLEMALKIKELSKWKGKVFLDDEEETLNYNFEQDILMNSHKIRQLLRFKEPFSLEQGLKNTIEYQKSQLSLA